MMDKYIGRLLDNRYEILEMIGSGGMAVVYKARCHRLNRLVAIKILKDDFLEDEDFRRRFHAESQAVAMLSHPNIVSVYDVSTSISMEADYIVMELIEGITLKQYMEKKGVLNWKETLHFAIQIAKALEHAHSRGVVHRDIKPHNVMVLKNGSVKVADFGIARLMTKGDTLTKEALGSVHYISPEQAKGGRVDNRSDIYSLGVVMYEMMSGRPPYEGESPVSVAIQHINGGAIMPSTLNPNIPGGMEQIIMKAMSHELKDRYATATQMLADMDEFRKNPALLFDYHTPPLDEVTKLNHSTLVLSGSSVKSTADRVEEKAEAHRNKRRSEREAAAAAAARKREYESDGRGSRVATAAIIACSLVAIIAIVVFLVIFFNGLGSGTEMVTAPNLVGKYFDALPETGDYIVKEYDYRQFSAEFEEGQIIRQDPVGGSKIAKGAKIHVLVSKGKQTEPVMMPELSGQTEATARHQLDQLGLVLDVGIKEEYHNDITVGKVIRTEPAAGKELQDDQKVTLILSLGKAPEETDPIADKKVPGVVGFPLTDALSALSAAGFTNIEPESVYSEEAPGIVLRQSVEKDRVVKTDTLIKLEVSMGPDPNATEPPTEPDPTDPPSTEPDPTDPPSTEPPTEPPVTDPPVIDPDPTDPDVIDPAA